MKVVVGLLDSVVLANVARLVVAVHEDGYCHSPQTSHVGQAAAVGIIDRVDVNGSWQEHLEGPRGVGQR